MKTEEEIQIEYQKALTDMDECENYDCEVSHCSADHILCKFLNTLGYTELVEKFQKLEKWYA
jgi:hypothetical protein